MKKIVCFMVLCCCFGILCYSQNAEVSIRVTNIAVNGGKVYLVLFSTAENFRNERPDFYFELSDNRTSATQVAVVPSGDYVISVFQDANNNQRLDFNLIGIPRELVGISNYSGQGFPSRNFDRQKIRIDSSTGTVTIPLHRF